MIPVSFPRSCVLCSPATSPNSPSDTVMCSQGWTHSAPRSPVSPILWTCLCCRCCVVAVVLSLLLLLLSQVAEAIVKGSPSIASQAQFVFVPGPGDPVPMGGMLPALPMEDFLVRGVRKRLPHATFATNPARLRFLSQEVVVFRRDLFRQLRRLCVIEPKEEESASALVKTLADQAHFCSVPSNSLTVSPDYDPLLRLYPLPHLVVIAEADHAWEASYKGCDFLCPGSLSSAGSFATYRPSTGVVQFAQLPGVSAP
eukprot:Hpha_TRINITY_DN15207_c2_g8::TRINITY_DN15207_c2_g8_i2::g.67061::m.67061/K02325/POLE2; DNA polymerase epsilon subunit 2